MGKLQICEPQFYEFWRAHQTPGDPQLDRWIDYEGDQLALGRERIAEVSQTFQIAGIACWMSAVNGGRYDNGPRPSRCGSTLGRR
jgi:hypothetical protein